MDSRFCSAFLFRGASRTGKLAVAEIPLCSRSDREMGFGRNPFVFEPAERSHIYLCDRSFVLQSKSVCFSGVTVMQGESRLRQQESLGCSVGLTLWKLFSYVVIRSAADRTALFGVVFSGRTDTVRIKVELAETERRLVRISRHEFPNFRQ